MDKHDDTNTCVAYNDLESVEKRWSISQTAELKVAGVVFGNITISPGAEKHFFYVANKGVAQVLHRIHHHPAIDCIT